MGPVKLYENCWQPGCGEGMRQRSRYTGKRSFFTLNSKRWNSCCPCMSQCGLGRGGSHHLENRRNFTKQVAKDKAKK